MSYRYPHFIKQNIAPSGAKKILVCDAEGKKVVNIPLGGLTPPNTKPLYSFGLVSDIHLYDESKSWITWNPQSKFDNALSFFEEQGCVMCIAAGDLTQTGFYNEKNAGDYFLDEASQFGFYKEICDKHTIPVYELAGNHESYYSQPITQNLDKWEAHTGTRELSYTVSQGDDLFILLGQPRDLAVMSDEDLLWFRQALESNMDKRCFVFVHSYIEEDSGDPGDLRENSIFSDDFWGAANRIAFVDLIKAHPNIILFHGHSHMKFECQGLYSAMEQLTPEQESYKAANYTDKNGFKSVHIPSLGRPRSIDLEAGTTPYVDGEAQGYVVDVYEDCIVLCGMDLIHNVPIPLGVYKITI